MNLDIPCRKDCPIPNGGVCPRHGFHKYARWVELCRTRDDYFQSYEDGRGPGSGPRFQPDRPRNSPKGPGSQLSRLLGRCCEFPHIDVMNEWGIAGCQEHRQEIINWICEFSLTFQSHRMADETAERLLQSALNTVARRLAEVVNSGTSGAS